MSKVVIILVLVGLFFLFLQFTSGNKKAAQDNKQKGTEFLAANGKLEGVRTTDSGLQYQVLQPGTGQQHPKATDTVTVHYHGTLIDGTVFDSSVERGQPIEFGLHQVIRGWTEGLQLMVVGEKARLFIPSELAYGNRKTGSIAPGSTLIFDVELLAINE
ncbi:FKBP-type peptidyl-prolyl cis-trans isomerase [Pseudohalioglobus sediminis]|uniref:Peptidyl-prolyl cis-trans isomerase n=1 Tax=Pseudohalioglobus sediminis TaxID=2606449 RepID=A0A5B0WT15_9GAMM|nr:FKBP-type peptidyl-prolyl cis-trans isomerase [Pseudohalioglobus sediminis]